MTHERDRRDATSGETFDTPTWDTHEQAAASPSAVGEGHDFETQQIMIADPRKFIVTHVYKVKRDGRQRVDSYQCESDESARILLEMLTRSLSSQAPKPASAGAIATLETIRFHLRRGDHVDALAGRSCTQQILDAIDKIIAAKPASAGGELVLAANALVDEVDKVLNGKLERSPLASAMQAVRQAIAAEADTAKEGAK